MDDAQIYIVPEVLGTWVCSVRKNMMGDANARLIAAAPELLEALKAGVATFGAWADMTEGTRKTLELCEAAIAKAEAHR